MEWFSRTALASLFALASLAAHAAPVDINTADAAALADALSGIGPSKAAAIVAYREQHGPFKSAEDLVLIKGIGDRTLDLNRENIVVSGGKP